MTPPADNWWSVPGPTGPDGDGRASPPQSWSTPSLDDPQQTTRFNWTDTVPLDVAPQPPAPPRSSRRPGPGTVALIVVLALVAALIGADRAVHAYAEGQVASRLQTAFGTSTAPTVSIAGFPFLDQLASGHYHRVSIDAGALPAQGTDGLAIDDLHVTLTDVTATDRFSHVTAGRLEGTVGIGYATLSQRAGNGLALSYGGTDPAGHGRIKATASTTVFGRVLAVSATGGLSVDAAQQTVAMTDPTLSVVGLTLPASLSEALAGSFLHAIPVGALPLGVELDDVAVGQDGIDASIAGTDVLITG